MPTNTPQEAQGIYTELAPDAVFPSISLDFSGSSFELPSRVNNTLYQDVPGITLDQFTSGPEGTGSFDTIMQSLKDHLGEEYENNRITGEQYTKAYIELTTAALSTGLQFILQKDQIQLQNQLVQAQARAAEIMAVTAAAQLEEQKQNAVLAQFSALRARAEFALTKMKLATEDISIAKMQYETNSILPQQYQNLLKDAAIKDYQISNTLVQQFKLLQEQTEVQHAQTSDARIDGDTVVGAIGKQKELYSEQIASYKRDARYKVGKMYLDAWITQKSLDEGLLAPTQLNLENINEVLVDLRVDNDLDSANV